MMLEDNGSKTEHRYKKLWEYLHETKDPPLKITYQALAENHKRPYVGRNVNEMIYHELEDPRLTDLDLSQQNLIELFASAVKKETEERAV